MSDDAARREFLDLLVRAIRITALLPNPDEVDLDLDDLSVRVELRLIFDEFDVTRAALERLMRPAGAK
jgi:hypothetical protein